MKRPKENRYITIAKLLTEVSLICEDIGRYDLDHEVRKILLDPKVKEAKEYLYSV